MLQEIGEGVFFSPFAYSFCLESVMHQMFSEREEEGTKQIFKGSVLH